MKENKTTAHFRYLKSFSWFIVVLSAGLVLGGTLSLMGWLPTDIWAGLDVFLTKMTQIFGFAAVFLILFRTIWISVEKRKTRNVRWVFSIWQFSKHRHVLFGWIVVAVGTAHSLYFLLFLPSNMNGVYSGLLAFAVMIVLVFFGYKMNQKVRTSRNVRTAHTILGIFFTIALVYHMVELH